MDRRLLAGRGPRGLDLEATFLFGDLGFSTSSRLGVLVRIHSALAAVSGR